MCFRYTNPIQAPLSTLVRQHTRIDAHRALTNLVALSGTPESDQSANFRSDVCPVAGAISILMQSESTTVRILPTLIQVKDDCHLIIYTGNEMSTTTGHSTQRNSRVTAASSREVYSEAEVEVEAEAEQG